VTETEIFAKVDTALFSMILLTPRKKEPTSFKMRARDRAAVVAWIAEHLPGWEIASDAHGNPILAWEDRAQR
jgi:hypothetical protein